MSFKLKDMVLIASFALVSTWLLDYMLGGKKGSQEIEQKSGQSFTASKKPRDIRPLNTEVSFFDKDRARHNRQEYEIVETDGARLTFTNRGATLERLEFKKDMGGRPDILTIVYPVADVNLENSCFLVALDENTPFNYEKIERRDDIDKIIIAYKANCENGSISKTFIIHKNSFKIDFELLCTMDGPYRPRIFFPAPVLSDLGEHDITSGFVLNDRHAMVITPQAKINFEQGWFSPELFGAQDKYFINAMIADGNHFTQRAYFHTVDRSPLMVILEGPETMGMSTWSLSFYCGPKESSALTKVDSRLEETLEHAGWFAPLSRLLLAILVFLFYYLGNYGVAIIALTILMRLLLWPLAIKSARATKKGSAQDIQKRQKYIEILYKNDPELLAKERAILMRQQGSMLISGCLPLLLQIPIMYALNRALASSILLYGAPFLWIPDLSSRDPYMILPALFMLATFAQAMYMDRQQRTTMFMVGLGLGIFSINFPAGLALYFGVSALIAAFQSFLQKKIGIA